MKYKEYCGTSPSRAQKNVYFRALVKPLPWLFSHSTRRTPSLLTHHPKHHHSFPALPQPRLPPSPGKEKSVCPGQQGQVTLEDGQQAISSQVPLGIVAELQSSGGAGTPPAGPLLGASAGPGGGSSAGACPGGARVVPLAKVGEGCVERRVLDTIALHGAQKGRCQPRLQAAPAPNALLNTPRAARLRRAGGGASAVPPRPASLLPPLLPRGRPYRDVSPHGGLVAWTALRDLLNVGQVDKHVAILQQHSSEGKKK